MGVHETLNYFYEILYLQPDYQGDAELRWEAKRFVHKNPRGRFLALTCVGGFSKLHPFFYSEGD